MYIDRMTTPEARDHRAVRAAVKPPIRDSGWHDYADAFELAVPDGFVCDPERVLRRALEEGPRVGGIATAAGWRVLRLRLGPGRSAEHIQGWRITAGDQHAMQIEASGPLVRGTLVLRCSPRTVSITTHLRYERSAAGAAVWAVVGVVHRRLAPFLLERAASLR